MLLGGKKLFLICFYLGTFTRDVVSFFHLSSVHRVIPHLIRALLRSQWFGYSSQRGSIFWSLIVLGVLWSSFPQRNQRTFQNLVASAYEVTIWSLNLTLFLGLWEVKILQGFLFLIFGEVSGMVMLNNSSFCWFLFSRASRVCKLPPRKRNYINKCRWREVEKGN